MAPAHQRPAPLAAQQPDQVPGSPAGQDVHTLPTQAPLVHWVPQQQGSPSDSVEPAAGVTTMHSPASLLAALHHFWARPPLSGHWQVLLAEAHVMLPLHSSAPPDSQPVVGQQAVPSARLSAVARARHSARASHQCWFAVGQAQVLLVALHVMLPLHSSVPSEGQLASGQQATLSSCELALKGTRHEPVPTHHTSSARVGHATVRARMSGTAWCRRQGANIVPPGDGAACC